MEEYNYNFAIGAPSAYFENLKDKSYQRGVYIFDNGIVKIYSQKVSKGWLAAFDYYFNGRGYFRNITRKKPFTELSLSILAGKFGKEIYKTLSQ